MTDPHFEQALDLVVARTGVVRYRWLCSEANTLPPPNSRADWRRWVLASAVISDQHPVAREDGPPAPAIVVHYRDPDAPPAGPCGGCP